MNPVEERFWSKVYMCPMSGCWLWMGALDHGYGRIRTGAKYDTTHRYSYELHKGAIPSGLEIDHICRNRACCNPAHLRAVTIAENIMAEGSQTPGAVNARKARCPRCGGDYSKVPSGGRLVRRCEACAQAWREAHREEKRAYDKLRRRAK